MAKDAQKLIIEFNGLPGCGKSTTANELLKQIGEDKASFPYDRHIKKFYQLLKSLVDGTIPFVIYCILILRNFKSSSIAEKKYFIMVAYGHYQLYLHFINHSNKKYLIVDQGLVQDIISFAFQDKIISDKYVRKLIRFCINKFGESLLIVNCDVDVETSSQRISLRGKMDGSRLDKIYKESPNKAKETLSVQNYNFNVVRNNIKKYYKSASYNISCIDDVNKNVMDLLSITDN